MLSSVSVAAGSAVVLVLLVALFRAEAAHKRRLVLGGLRAFFDTMLIRAGVLFHRFFRYFETGTARATFHFLVHALLSRVIALLERFQAYLSSLELRNKRVATVIKDSRKKSHLDEIAVYKEEHSLSEEEKRKRKSHK